MLTPLHPRCVCVYRSLTIHNSDIINYNVVINTLLYAFIKVAYILTLSTRLMILKIIFTNVSVKLRLLNKAPTQITLVLLDFKHHTLLQQGTKKNAYEEMFLIVWGLFKKVAPTFLSRPKMIGNSWNAGIWCALILNFPALDNKVLLISAKWLRCNVSFNDALSCSHYRPYAFRW